MLVILGLLTGGILAGKSLIRASELRSVTNDFTRYKSAMAGFRDKYFYLPGDMPNAVRFWGAQTGSTNDGPDYTCRMLDYSNPATGIPTCNGNGDGVIGFFSNMSASYNMYESYRAWQHLANAGMIEGQYAGVPNSPNGVYNGYNVVMPGYNVPPSEIGQAGYNLIGWQNVVAATYANSYFSSSYGNVMLFGAASNAYFHSMNLGAVITRAEAWNIDTKLDDGLPGQGAVMVPTGCASSIDETTAIYNLSNSSIACGLIFKLKL